MTPAAGHPAARAAAAFAFGVPIGGLAGLIGLGGGEFRLPVLVAILGFAPRAAVPMNLVVSLVTLAASLFTRAGTLSLAPVAPHLPEVAGLAAGGVLGAVRSARLLIRLSDHRLESALALLLAMISAGERVIDPLAPTPQERRARQPLHELLDQMFGRAVQAKGAARVLGEGRVDGNRPIRPAHLRQVTEPGLAPGLQNAASSNPVTALPPKW